MPRRWVWWTEHAKLLLQPERMAAIGPNAFAPFGAANLLGQVCMVAGLPSPNLCLQCYQRSASGSGCCKHGLMRMLVWRSDLFGAGAVPVGPNAPLAQPSCWAMCVYWCGGQSCFLLGTGVHASMAARLVLCWGLVRMLVWWPVLLSHEDRCARWHGCQP